MNNLGNIELITTAHEHLHEQIVRDV